MKRIATATLGVLAFIGAALVIPSILGGDGSYEWEDETELKSYGVTDDELTKLTKAYERRERKRGSLAHDADTVATRYIYVAVANSQAADIQRLLRGVMCPSGNASEKMACDAAFSAKNAGRVCNASNVRVGYVVGFPATTAQRSVLAKWRNAFTLMHVVSVPFSEMRAGSNQFWAELNAMSLDVCDKPED